MLLDHAKLTSISFDDWRLWVLRILKSLRMVEKMFPTVCILQLPILKQK